MIRKLDKTISSLRRTLNSPSISSLLKTDTKRNVDLLSSGLALTRIKKSSISTRSDQSSSSSNDVKASIDSLINKNRIALDLQKLSKSDDPNNQTQPSSSKKEDVLRSRVEDDSFLNRDRSILFSDPKRFGKNQDLEISDREKFEELNGILKTFRAPIRYAIGYGSGIFPQKPSTTSKEPTSSKDGPMLDFIFAVSHPNHWHSINLQQNPGHYSLLARSIGSGSISWLQERGPGAGVWFNLENKVNDKIIKYGVISVDELCNDLLDWNTLYVSGRMHKPTLVLRDDARIRLAQQVNLGSAIRASLLILPERFDEFQLYRTISCLSYQGDFRFKVKGEDPEKVEKIVKFQLKHFRKLYKPLIKSLRLAVHGFGEGDDEGGRILKFEQDRSIRSRSELYKKLPSNLKKKIESGSEVRIGKGGGRSEEGIDEDEELMMKVLNDPKKFEDALRAGLGSIVFRTSLNQSLKGILSSGPTKSFKYSLNKLYKGWTKSS